MVELINDEVGVLLQPARHDIQQQQQQQQRKIT